MNRAVSLLILAAFSFVLYACSSAGSFSSGPGLVAVDVLLADRHVTLLHATTVGDRPASPASSDPGGVRWEFRGRDGQVLATGRGPDVRHARYEFGEGGKVDGVSDPRSAVGTLAVEIPNVDGSLQVWEADGTAIGAASFDALATSADGVAEASLVNLSTDVLGAPVPLVVHGPAKERVTFLLLPDGFTEAELPKFHATAADVVAKLSQIPGYREHWDGFNVYYQDVRSASSGIYDPKLGGTPKNTAFESSFGDGVRSPRRCVLPSDRIKGQAIASMKTIGRAVSADMIIVIANSQEYGGCAMPWEKLAVMTSNTLGVRIVAHEIGHALFGLDDEYDVTPPTCNRAALKSGHPNVSSDLRALPWADLVSSGTALPTAPGATAGKVGAFEGAGYCVTGAYRPTERCMMRNLDDAFCPVCLREIDRFFAKRKDTAPLDVAVTNKSGAGTFVKCADRTAPANRCSGYTYVAPGKTVTIHTTDRAMIVDNSTVSDAKFSWSEVRVAATGNAVTLFPSADPLRP